MTSPRGQVKTDTNRSLKVLSPRKAKLGPTYVTEAVRGWKSAKPGLMPLEALISWRSVKPGLITADALPSWTSANPELIPADAMPSWKSAKPGLKPADVMSSWKSAKPGIMPTLTCHIFTTSQILHWRPLGHALLDVR